MFDEYRHAEKDENKAHDKIVQLKIKAHSESLELEAKHERLMAKVDEAQKELESFRESELGLSAGNDAANSHEEKAEQL